MVKDKDLYPSLSSGTLNPDYAVDTYCDLKNLVAFASQHIYKYAFGTKSLQLLVSLRFFNPRDDAYCIIWVKSGIQTFHGKR
jgi:hypothetical protein